MATGIASGLGATWGFALESTVGTFATPVAWIPHTKAEFQLKKKPVESKSLRGNKFLLASRRNILSYTVDGSISLDLASRNFGKLFQAALGSTPVNTVQGATAAYLQTHAPGTLEGTTLSSQKGIPQVGGTIQAYSYNGLKVTDWTLTVARDQIATFDLTLDGWNESTATAYTATSYLAGASAPSLFDFSLGSLLLGGAITFNSTTLSTSTGTAPTGIVSAVTIKGTNKVNVNRVPLGSQTKKEQISNDFTVISGEVEMEFANPTDFYNNFQADTTTSLFLTLAGRSTIATGYYPTVQIAIPAIKWETGTPTESGGEIITVKVPFTAYDDGAGDPVIQLQYLTLDTAP